MSGYCPKCGAEHKSDESFCGACGANLQETGRGQTIEGVRAGRMYCRNCGKELDENAEFCVSCGMSPLKGRNFCNRCGANTIPAAEVCVKCGTKLRRLDSGVYSTKSRLAATLLAWFLGMFGAHRFYLGKGGAVVMLVLSLIGCATVWIFGIGLLFVIPMAIWGLVDFILVVSGSMLDGEGRLVKLWDTNE